MLTASIPLSEKEIADFCRRWKIAKLEVFGSVLRDDFRPDSDVDLLATFELDANWSLLDRVSMKLELEEMLGREVDLLNRMALEKRHRSERSRTILNSAELLYARP